jgi:hypothetical protein
VSGFYAGGGGGVGRSPSAGGTGGSGGGGAGSSSANGSAGTVNTGSGGSIGGGSGIVILRYSDLSPDLTNIAAGLTWTKYTTGGYKYYKFTAGTGTVTV